MASIVATDADEDLIGTLSDDWIYGLGGKDRLYGKAGTDRLFGGGGNDNLDGGAGADIMFGGSGDDIYRVDHVGDMASEESVGGVDDGGIDTVQSSVAFTLGRFIERLTLIGTAAIDGTGNELANRITGNEAANTLSGGSGNDTLIGGGGDDRLVGGAGKDTLTGGTGSDTFIFGRADTTSIDKVTDFTHEDWVGIFANQYELTEGSGLLDDGTGKLVLDGAYFATVTESTNVQGTASDHGQFVFNATTLSLMWDADGAGTTAGGIALATLNAGAALSAADFAILTAAPNDPLLAQSNVPTAALNHSPVAPGSRSVTLNEDTPSTALAIGATDADGDRLGYSLGALPAKGAVSFDQAAGTFGYTPHANVNGSDIFSIVVSDGRGGTAQQAVMVTITAVNDTPVAAATNSVITGEDTPSAAVAIGATDVDGDTLSYSVKAGAAPANGTVSFNQAAGTLVYTPNANVNGSDAFTIVVSDGRGGTTEQAVTVTINPVYDAPTVVKILDLRAIGSTDPSGLAYNPQSQNLFVCDSEVDESPFSRAANLFTLGTDGTLKQSFSLWSPTGFTKEPTGLTFDLVTGHLFICDDDKLKVFWVDPANPTVKRGEFLTRDIGGYDPEDLASDPSTGHLFILNGVAFASGQTCSIVETTNTGTLVSTMIMPAEITDPEALAYDAREDVFYIGGGFSSTIWKVDRSGAILGTIDILAGFRNPLSGTKVHVKDLELAPSSDPNDNPSKLSLFVADYGSSHVDDGRLFEISLGDLVLA
jgi:hypothetical protein